MGRDTRPDNYMHLGLAWVRYSILYTLVWNVCGAEVSILLCIHVRYLLNWTIQVWPIAFKSILSNLFLSTRTQVLHSCPQLHCTQEALLHLIIRHTQSGATHNLCIHFVHTCTVWFWPMLSKGHLLFVDTMKNIILWLSAFEVFVCMPSMNIQWYVHVC